MLETNNIPTPENQPEHQQQFEAQTEDTFNILTPQVLDELKGLFPEDEYQATNTETPVPLNEEEIAELEEVFQADQEAGYQAGHDRYVTSGISVANTIDETIRATTTEMERQQNLKRALKTIDPPLESDAEKKSKRAWSGLGARATTELAPRFNR